jgi:hypothetical protein
MTGLHSFDRERESPLAARIPAISSRCLPCEEIAAEDRVLAQAYGKWIAAGGLAQPPRRRALGLDRIRGITGRVALMDVSATHAHDYVFLHAASEIRVVRHMVFERNQRAGDLEDTGEDFYMTTFAEAALSGMPMYHLVMLRSKTMVSSYARLILPLAEHGSRVDRLLLVVNARRIEGGGLA